MNSILAYSTTSGQTAIDFRPEVVAAPVAPEEYWDEYCFICGRCTDHSGEHTDRVEVSEYETRTWEDGTVEHYIRTFEAIGPLTEEAHNIAVQWRRDY